MTRRRRAATVAAAAVLAAAWLSACSSDKPPPTALQTFTPTLSVRQAWTARVDSVKFPLIVAVRDSAFVVAGSDGAVLALNADDGRELWRADAKAALAAGVGSDGRWAAVVTRNNEVIAFDKGREVWRQRVPARVVTAPLVAGERVFVMSVDRAVQAFDAQDGRKLWALQRPGDALTLAQAGVITSYKNSLLVGQGVRLAALDPLRGTLLWEVPMAAPRGTNEVERLADLLGPPLKLADKVCARAFQSAVACADASRGAVLWTRNAGGIQPIGGTDELLFGADASDRITAWKTGSGDIAWTNEKLLYRELSGALAVGGSVVFGDLQGYVHFLSTANGELQLRLPTDGSAVVGTPALSGNTVLVTTRKGGLFAFRL